MESDIERLFSSGRRSDPRSLRENSPSISKEELKRAAQLIAETKSKKEELKNSSETKTRQQNESPQIILKNEESSIMEEKTKDLPLNREQNGFESEEEIVKSQEENDDLDKRRNNEQNLTEDITDNKSNSEKTVEEIKKETEEIIPMVKKSEINKTFKKAGNAVQAITKKPTKNRSDEEVLNKKQEEIVQKWRIDGKINWNKTKNTVNAANKLRKAQSNQDISSEELPIPDKGKKTKEKKFKVRNKEDSNATKLIGSYSREQFKAENASGVVRKDEEMFTVIDQLLHENAELRRINANLEVTLNHLTIDNRPANPEPVTTTMLDSRRRKKKLSKLFGETPIDSPEDSDEGLLLEEAAAAKVEKLHRMESAVLGGNYGSRRNVDTWTSRGSEEDSDFVSLEECEEKTLPSTSSSVTIPKLDLSEFNSGRKPKPQPVSNHKRTLSSSSYKKPHVRRLSEPKPVIKTEFKVGKALFCTPFQPELPQEIQIGYEVKFIKTNGNMAQGRVKYIGYLPGKTEVFYGIHLDEKEGRHDGTYQGKRFFKCPDGYGTFVPYKKIIAVWKT